MLEEAFFQFRQTQRVRELGQSHGKKVYEIYNLAPVRRYVNTHHFCTVVNDGWNACVLKEIKNVTERMSHNPSCYAQ